jgi:hypothetical protein
MEKPETADLACRLKYVFIIQFTPDLMICFVPGSKQGITDPTDGNRAAVMSPSHDIAPVRQAVFLVGGKGTRLGGLTANTPKPLLELAPGLRFLDVLIEGAARQGFNDIILLAGHLGEQVVELYDGRTFRGARISVIREPEPAGTGGALRFAADRLAPFFMLANGD